MGDATEGEAGDRYLALARQALHGNFNAPVTIPRGNALPEGRRRALPGTGRPHRPPSVREALGEPAFDDAVERAIRQTAFRRPAGGSRALPQG